MHSADIKRTIKDQVDKTDVHTLDAQSMEQILELLPSGLVILDGNGVISKVNSVASNLLSCKLVGVQWGSVVRKVFAPQADDGHELSLKNGRRVQLSISAFGDKPGQIIMLTDLTQTRALQARVAHMQRLSALGNMMASLAHQIRTPLSAALLYGGNLKNPHLTETARIKFVGKMMSRMQDLEAQVNDMLLFAKSGDQQIVEPLSMQSLLHSVYESSEALVGRAQCQLDVMLPDPDLIILANKTALSSAIGNLIDNAVKAYGPVGSDFIPRLITLAAQKDSDGQVTVSVTDNGPGISEQEQMLIMEPFYTTRPQGTGLGLAVVQGVARSHEGKVSLESKIGCGSTFALHLPILREEPNKAHADINFKQVVGGQS